MKTIKNLTANQIRKSILQLAIQGKLVKQDSNDEPASELVKRIYEEKQRLIKEGKIKKNKNESYIYKGDDNCYYEKVGSLDAKLLENIPFELPNGWAWIRQSNLCWLDNGNKTQSGELPYLEAKVIRQNKPDKYQTSGVVVDSNFKLILVDGENSGEIFTPPFQGYMGSTFKILDVTSEIDFQYLLLIFELNLDLYRNSKTGAAIPHLNKKLFQENLIALPPLNEQLRIVKKLSEFDPLLERYQNIEKELSSYESTFEEKLKASILQYAIEGKLVKQDPNDEPASKLLERIKAEKEKLIQEGKIKRDKIDSEIVFGDDKNYYVSKKLPASWSLVKARQLTKKIQYGLSVSGQKSGKYKLLRITDIQNGQVNWDTLPFCDISEQNYIDYKIERDDIFIARTGGTIGKSFRLAESKENVVFAGYLIRFQLIFNTLSQYISRYLNSPAYWKQVSDKSMGTGQPNINSVSLGNLVIPLPPASEQKRISNKISKLFYIIKSH